MIMRKKQFKHDIPKTIIGMSLNDAKNYCLSEGYQLNLGDKTLNETYLVTVKEIDSDGKIVDAKYGK